MTSSKKINDTEKIVSSYGPFEIIDLLKSMNSKNKEKLVCSLEGNKSTLAHLIYFQKYLEKFVPDFARSVQEMAIADHHRYLNDNNELPYAVSDFSLAERKKIYKGLIDIQFTSGCSGACSFCGFDAPIGLRDRVPSNHQLGLIKEIGCYPNKIPRLTWANDGLEMLMDVSEYENLLDGYFQSFRYILLLRTTIPTGTEELYKKICSGSRPSNLVVTINTQNVSRLKNKNIIKISKLEDIKSWNPDYPQHGGIEFPEVMNEIFSDGLAPGYVNIRYECELKNVGINRYNLPKKNYSICGSAGTIITPYGVHNVMDAFRGSKRYPQGHIVVALDGLDDQPIKIIPGERIESYLRRAVITDTIKAQREVRKYQIENLCSKATVNVDMDGIIVDGKKFLNSPSEKGGRK